MRSLFVTALCICAILYKSFAQVVASPTIIFNKEFRWTIEIPKGFESIAAEQWTKMQNRGAEAIEETYNATVENRAKTIFAFQSDRFNYFESNYQPFDTTKDGNYRATFNQVNGLIYGTFQAQLPKAKLDSASSEETINGKLFQTFKVDITIAENFVLQWIMYSRLFGKQEFTVNIMTADREKRQILLNAWKNSKFDN